MQKNISILLLIFGSVLLLNSGCDKGGDSFSILSATEQFPSSGASSTVNNKLDILFVINDQPSMSSFQDELVASMATFMNTFQTKGFDYKIAVVTTSGYMADPTLNGYDPVNIAEADFNDFNGTIHSGVHVLTPLDPNLFSNFAINAKPSKNTSGQDNRAFSSFRQALQNTRPVNSGFLRPNSFLAVIIVDNQDDFSGNGRCNGCNNNQRYNAPTLDPISVYKDFLDNVTGTSGATARYNVSAMAQTTSTCQGSSLSTRIMELANQTNGVLGDICQADFGPSMADIASRITLLSTQYYLARVPVLTSIRVLIDGVLIQESSTDGWTFDSTANSIQFHGTAVPQQGSNIVVNYDPASL